MNQYWVMLLIAAALEIIWAIGLKYTEGRIVLDETLLKSWRITRPNMLDPAVDLDRDHALRPYSAEMTGSARSAPRRSGKRGSW